MVVFVEMLRRINAMVRFCGHVEFSPLRKWKASLLSESGRRCQY